MNRNWREGQESNVTISDHEPDAFDGYLVWVYSNEISLNNDKCNECERISDRVRCNEVHSLYLAHMYVLGDYLQDVQFCDAVIDTMKDVAVASECFLPSTTTQYVWQIASYDSPCET